jgi:hypothetical protein
LFIICIMQITTLVLAALSAVSVSATPSWMGGDQVTIKEEYKVPGDNPLYFCGDPADDILKIEKADIDPNPPKPYVNSHTSLRLSDLDN